jgi:hypothetical protein
MHNEMNHVRDVLNRSHYGFNIRVLEHVFIFSFRNAPKRDAGGPRGMRQDLSQREALPLFATRQVFRRGRSPAVELTEPLSAMW